MMPNMDGLLVNSSVTAHKYSSSFPTISYAYYPTKKWKKQKRNMTTSQIYAIHQRKAPFFLHKQWEKVQDSHKIFSP